jgi:hypothetical protein
VRGLPLREAHLALKQTRVERRRGHYSNALRRASLGLRALNGAESTAASAARAQLQARYAWCRVARVATRMLGDGRSEPSPKQRAAHELDAQAQAHTGTARRRGVVRRIQARAARETALRIFEQLGDLTEQA